jgi:type IV pilus assembly protein PilY1
MKSLPFDRNAQRGLAKRLIAGAVLVAGVATPPFAAALTDISNAPIASAATTAVPPNVLFILDASGSMDSEFMPDQMGSYDGKASYASPLCNTIYYNPTITYLVPKNSDGTDFPGSTFTAARNDGFLTSGNTGSPSNLSSGGTTNLSSNYKGTTLSGTERAFYYKWNGASLPTTSECQGSAPSASRSFPHVTGNWEKVQIPAAEEQNFANWFTYYRTRILMMKTSAGRAFSALNDTFRVGFITICPDGSSCNSDTAVVGVNSGYYLKIDAFAPTHKAAWYAKFYQQVPSSFTPLRQALARAGRHFAGLKDGINSGMNDDPIQYSCQQNFSILTTDGYWNYGRGKTLTNGTSGSGDIGNWDSNLGLTPRPMFDGGPVNQVVTVTTNQDRYTSRTGTPNCSGATPVKARRTNQTVTQTTTTPQFGSPSTTTNTTNNSSANVCVASSPALSYTIVLSTTTTNANVATGSTSNTLADVAEYYYRNDLRAPGSTGALGTDVGTNNDVPPSGTGVEDDKATWQHMTTFTLGLGLDGQLTYDPNYKSQTTGDFADIRNNVKGWPNPNPGNPNTGTTSEQQARIDDLWHAAVNGRGQYFSAKNPTSLALSLQTALTSIQTRLSSSAAAATSTLEPTATDNLIVLPTYITSEWSGELQAFQIDVTPGSPTYGQVLPTLVWSAQTKLDAKTQAACDDRRIKLFHPGATDNLVDFTWNTTSCTTGLLPDGLDSTEQAFFTAAGAVDEVQDLSQWSLMTDGSGGTADQKTAARGENLVNFVRGQRGKEGFAPNDINKLYRARKHVLGDIVNSQPLYVRAAAFSYSDSGYAAFAASVASRTPMIYTAANDGMLHAFYGANDATGGDEAWAFIPRSVLPRLYKLADNNYANLHEYYVDGKPVRDDVFDTGSGTWKTILVAGLNKGGRGYYALDVTDPLNPKALWEFTYSPSVCTGPGAFSDCNLGYTFGAPVISKLLDGRWVVFVTSGYNNVNPTPLAGDGQGFLYVLEATTGKIIYKIGTGVGDPTTPSGLAKITAWVNDAEHNNTTLRVYGADLLGNVWRFDVNDEKDALGNPVLPPAGREAALIATLKDPSGTPQPVTIAPRLAEVGSPPSPYLFIGTGRYLGTTDVSDTQVQSIYAIRDPFTPTPYADLRASLNELKMTTVGSDRFVACNSSSPAACKSADGWFVDLTEPGERVNVSMELQLGTLVVASNVPANTACEPGGFSFLNFFDITSGFSPAGTTARSGYRTAGLTVGLSIVRLPNGTVVVYRQRSDPPPGGGIDKEDVPIASGAPTGKRSTWREILP